MKWIELKQFCDKLTEEQLQETVRIWGEGINCTKITDAEILEDDFFNPSGEGCEPVGIYKDTEDWEEVKDEPILLTKGTAILTGEL